MPITEARVETERSSRYLAQLCRHAKAMGSDRGHRFRLHVGGGAAAGRDVRISVEWSETHGVISFDPWGQCVLRADADSLVLRVEATDEENLGRIRDIIARNIDRFGRRDGLTLAWQPSTQPH